MTHDSLCPMHQKENGMCYASFYDAECQCDLISAVRWDQIKLIKQIINYRMLDYSECSREDECNIKADAGKTYIEDIEYHYLYGENNGQIGF